jgi:methyl-accepting chemotaxis protein
MQLDELTQQNAALVEEASAASQSMADQARGLNQAMQKYRVDGSQQVVATQAAPTVTAAAPAAGARAATAERRKPSRPWAAPKTAARAATPVAAPAIGGADPVWKEF